MVEAKFREEHLIASLPDTSIFLNTSLKLFFHIGITHKWMKELCSERNFSRERKSFLSTYRKANEGFKKTKHVKFSEKRTFLTPRNVRFFQKIWRALSSWNSRFEIRPFTLLPTFSPRKKILGWKLLVSQPWFKHNKIYVNKLQEVNTKFEISAMWVFWMMHLVLLLF